MSFRTDSARAGFTLVETLVYLAGFVLLGGVIVSVLVYGYGWYRYVTVAPRADQAGALAAQRLEDDIRAGDTLNAAQDTFDSVSGSISLNSLDSSKNPVTYRYYLQNGQVMYQKNGGTADNVTPADLFVSQLRFHQVTTPKSNAIRFTVGIDYPTSSGTTTGIYSGLGIMRGTYQ